MQYMDLESFLKNKNAFEFEILDRIDSTNEYLKSKAEAGASEGLVVIAHEQTAGKGRMGRAFASPIGSGIYMSLLLRPKEDACEGVILTVCAAVAVVQAIKAVTGIETDIKWVNDIYLNGKKICGILTQGAISKNVSAFDYAIVGIGLNLCDSFKGTELENIAGGLFDTIEAKQLEDLKCRLVCEITQRFYDYYYKGIVALKPQILQEYRKRLFIIGKQVDVISYTDTYSATVLDLNDDFSLKIRSTDGSCINLNSGEVRLRLK